MSEFITCINILSDLYSLLWNPTIEDKQHFSCKNLFGSRVLSYNCFMPRHSPYSYYRCHTFDIAAVGKIFNVFSYDAFWADNRTFPTTSGCATFYALHHESKDIKVKDHCYMLSKQFLLTYQKPAHPNRVNLSLPPTPRQMKFLLPDLEQKSARYLPLTSL